MASVMNGGGLASSNPAPDDPTAEGLAGSASNFRVPMGRDAVAAMVDRSSKASSLVPRYSGVGAQDPALFPNTVRTGVLYKPENGGARYGLKVAVKLPIMPEAAPTLANGRIVSSVGRGPAFGGGSEDAYV